MATEEFSFPTDLYPFGIDSPPLWRLSPAASPDVFLDRKSKEYCSAPPPEEEEEDCFADGLDKYHHQQRKSFSYVEKGNSKLSKEVVIGHQEEKMDLLWEDFNEELPAISPSSRSTNSEDMVELGCAAQDLNFSKTNANAAMFSPRRPAAGMLVFMRALRRLFLLHHNSQRSSVKHRKWKTP